MNFIGKKAGIDLDLSDQLGVGKKAIQAVTILVLCLSGCAPAPVETNIPSILDPRGPAAADINQLWWIIFGLGTAVFVAVTAILLYIIFARARRRRNLEEDLHAASGHAWIIWGGILIPFVILMITFFFGLRSSMAVLASPPAPETVTVEVIGHRWWWEVRYPDHMIVTANEIRIPAGQPVQIILTSADVIHSFWVPQLHGKMDLNPGELNAIWIQADEPGIYRGICAEFCGLQHAKMLFIVVAETPEAFDAWLAREQQPAPEPADDFILRGQQVFLDSTCVYCHTVRGTNATGVVGPDLTHLASRLTLGAGILENNRGNLAGWIIDPQQIKPGNLMPPTTMNAEDLQALLAYLETLE